jgi:hypothetical protein
MIQMQTNLDVADNSGARAPHEVSRSQRLSEGGDKISAAGHVRTVREDHREINFRRPKFRPDLVDQIVNGGVMIALGGKCRSKFHSIECVAGPSRAQARTTDPELVTRNGCNPPQAVAQYGTTWHGDGQRRARHPQPNNRDAIPTGVTATADIDAHR